MAKKKTIRTIPQERTPMREQDPLVRAKNFAEVACGYRLEDAMREVGALPDVPGSSRASRAARSHQHPGLHQEDQREEFPRRLRHPSPTPTCCRRSAAASARRKTSAKASARSATALEPVAIGRLERWVGDMAIAEGWANVPYIEPNGYRDRHRRLRPRRHGLRRRHGQGRLRRHRLRSLPRSRAAFCNTAFRISACRTRSSTPRSPSSPSSASNSNATRWSAACSPSSR